MLQVPPAGKPLRLKWFMGLNANSNVSHYYADMIRVAVITAQAYTSLHPHVVYDGPPCDLTEWLQRNGAVVIHWRSSLYDHFGPLSEKTGLKDYAMYGPGIYLRAELPTLCEKLGWTDEYILYTDTDVMFLPGFSLGSLGLGFKEPIAVGPESDPKNYEIFNTGVMVMNLPKVRAEEEAFKKRLLADLPTGPERAWDQYSYQQHFAGRIHKLTPELNWKPYWGKNADAGILHFHGPKPFSRTMLKYGGSPKIIEELAVPYFWELSEVWDQWMERIRTCT